MADDQSFKGFSQQMGGDVEATDQKAMEDSNALWDANTRAVNANAQARQKWGRLQKDQMTLFGKMEAQLSRVHQGLKSTSYGYQDLSRSAGGFFDKLKQGSTFSAMYNRKMDAMRKGQETFTKTLVATTGNLTQAMDQSQKYVNAVHDSYRSAHKMSAEFRVETKAMQKAVDDLNARFATQIAVSGDMKGAIEGMRREAFIMGRYLGTSMEDVMDSWNERLHQNIGTLDDARKEMVASTHEADMYAKGIKQLGDEYLKTGNIGKKQFVDMVRDASKLIGTGTIQIDGYSRALRNLMIETKKMQLSVNEQKGAAEGLAKVTKEMFTFGSELSLFGVKAAEQVRQMWNDPKWLAQQDEQVRKRLKMVQERFANEPEIVQTRAIMDVMRGSSAGSAMGMRMMANMTNTTLNREIIAKYTDNNMLQADAITKQIQSGEAEKAFNEKATQEAKDQRDKQVEVWRKDFEDMVKATHTPKDLDYKLVALVHNINKTLEYYVKYSIAGSLATQGLSFGGNLLMNKLTTGSFLGGGGGLFGGGSGLFGGGAASAGTATAGTAGTATAAGSGTAAAAAGALGTGAAIGAAFVGGVALGTAADYGFGLAVEKGLLGSREKKIQKLSGDKTFTSWVSRDPDRMKKFGIVSPTSMLAHALSSDKEISIMKQANEERVLMRGKEFATRKHMIEVLDERIKKLESYGKEITTLEQDELRDKKKQKKLLEWSIKNREDMNKMESKLAQQLDPLFEKRLKAVKKTISGLEFKKGMTTEEKAAQYYSEALEKGTLESGLINEGRMGEAVYKSLLELPESRRKQFGDLKKFAEAVSRLATKTEDIAALDVDEFGEAKKKMSPEERRKRIAEIYGKTELTEKFSTMSPEQLKAYSEAQGFAANFQISGGGEGLGEQVGKVATNAKNQIELQLPGRTIKLEGLGPAVAVTNSKEK